MSQFRLGRGFVALVITLLMVLQATLVNAGTTGSLTGVVIDGQTQQPLAKVVVTVSGPTQSAKTTTDSNGRFGFISLSPDTYVVSAEIAGRDTVVLNGISVLADQSRTVTLTAVPTIKTIGRVTSRSASDLVKPGTTADVYSITAAQSEKFAAAGGGGALNSAYSAIATIPGAYVPQGQSGYYPTVNIRGGDYDQVGYELDGIPVNRSFDNYPSGPTSSLGQQELQVYTGAAPANAEGQGLSGFVNQVFRTGTYPGFRSFDVGVGGPAFYHKFSAEFGGATPSRNFTYYAGFGGYNQDFRYADQFNGASLTQNYGVFLAPCSSAFSQKVAPSCYSPSGQYYTGNSNGNATDGYVLAPYNLGGTSSVSVRDSIVNLHFGIPRRDGSKDDIQLLFNNNFISTQYYISTNDQGGQALTNTLLGTPTYTNGYQYNGPTGVLLPSNYQSLAQIYNYPQSNQNGSSTIDVNRRDANVNNQAIFKAQYQHNFGTSAFLRVYGYTYYSNWLQVGPQSAYANYIGPVSPDYELSSHTRGVSATFSDQLNDKHLLTVQGSYTVASTLRDNNTQMFDSGGPRSVFGVLVDSTNPTNGLCYDLTGAVQSCTRGAGAQYVSLKQAYNGSIAAPTGTCGAGPCGYFVVGNGLYATYNTVKPKFGALSITDNFSPTPKLTINYGLRLDSFTFDGSNTNTGPARDLYFNAFNLDNCVDSTGAVVAKTGTPTGPCQPGTTAAQLRNVPSQINTYSIFQPRAAFTYSVDPTTVIRASYGRYAQAPNAEFQQYNTLQANLPALLGSAFYKFGFTTPGHEVRPPTSNNYDVSFEHGFKGSDISFKLTPFLRKTQDQIQQFYLDQKSGFVSGLNVGRQTSQGFEFEVDKGDFARDGIAAKLAFTYTNSYIKYNTLSNGSTVVTGINGDIQTYNAYTSFCASNPGDKKCGSTTTGVAAAPCYTPSGAPDAACASTSVANPYWQAPVQSLIDSNASFATYDLFPGPIGSAAAAYGAPYFATVVLQYKHKKVALTPTLQFAAGQKYGAPETSPGIDPAACAAGLAGSATSDGRYKYGAAGGSGYDATQCGTLPGAIPDPATGNFDGIGSFRAPSSLQLHFQAAYAIDKRTTLTANFANVINRCFGGTKTSFTVSGACSYGVIGTGQSPVGNVFNPGQVIQPVLAQPYQPGFAGYPFNVYFNLKVKT